jgi:hypothetical protein
MSDDSGADSGPTVEPPQIEPIFYSLHRTERKTNKAIAHSNMLWPPASIISTVSSYQHARGRNDPLMPAERDIGKEATAAY